MRKCHAPVLAVLTLLATGGNIAFPQSQPQAVPAQSWTIPFKYQSSVIEVEAVVAGKQAQFLFDTGAAGTMLNSKFVQAAKLQTTSRKARLFTSATIYKGPADALFDLPFLLGGDKIPLPIVLASNMADLEQEMGLAFDGILGSSLFLARRVTVDYAMRSITWDGAPVEPSSAAFVSKINRKLLPIVHVRLLDSHNKWIKADLLVDTGSNDTLTLSAPFVRKHPDLLVAGSVRPSGQKFRGVYGQAAFSDGVVPALALGPTTLQQLPATLPQVQSGMLASKRVAGSIGNDVLCHYRLTLDYILGEAILEPYAKSGSSTLAALPPCNAASAANLPAP